MQEKNLKCKMAEKLKFFQKREKTKKNTEIERIQKS